MNKLKTIFWVNLFAVAMGFLETAVVIYLRELYYPEGFAFPLQLISVEIAKVEIIREAATIIMLVAIGIIAGKTNFERFGYFIYSFGVWDIFYYVFLKLMINWPSTLLTDDILFLIPLAWVGPVICPIINSLTMIILALVIIYFSKSLIIPKLSWLLFIFGSFVIILSYTLDYINFLQQYLSLPEIFDYKNSYKLIEFATKYKPLKFYWTVFVIGEIMHLAGIGLIIKNNKKR